MQQRHGVRQTSGVIRCVRRPPRPARRLGRIFFLGLLTVLPFVVTVYFTVWLLGVMERFFGKQAKLLLPNAIYDEWYRPGMGIAVAILVVLAVGVLMHAYLFRRVFKRFERLLLEIPLVRSVYAAMRDLLGLFAQHKDPALQVVMVTVPGTQWRLLGFVTRADCGDAAKGIAADGQVAVYFPMSYQVGGYTVFLPKEAVTPVDMSREDAMKFILTAGLKTTPPAAPPPGEKRI